MGGSLHIQLWSYNFAPEPTGIGPLVTVWARAMKDRGHSVEVVAAHPHYPEPVWGTRWLPYRERREGIPVTRLPIWPGRTTAAQRLRQEISFVTGLTLAAPFLRRPDAIVAVSPSFPALAPTLMASKLRDVPFVLWLQDILPDGALATGILDEGRAVRAARDLERRAYSAAARIVVLAPSFRDNLVAKGVPANKVVVAHNPASRPVRSTSRDAGAIRHSSILTMGNIGHSQNLRAVVEAFECSPDLAEREANLVIAGDGVAGDEVRAAVRTPRVDVTGILDDRALGLHLSAAQVALVSQRYEGAEFNVPSKLMNFMAEGLPVAVSAHPDSEAGRLVKESGAGWVTDSRDLSTLVAALTAAIDDPGECLRRGELGRRFATEQFTPAALVETFDRTLQEITFR